MFTFIQHCLMCGICLGKLYVASVMSGQVHTDYLNCNKCASKGDITSLPMVTSQWQVTPCVIKLNWTSGKL